MSDAIDLASIAVQMEGIGRNCEFGLVQRRAGVEPIGLLRFAESPLDALTQAVRSRFAGLGTNLEFTTARDGEWIGRSCGLTFHSNRHADQLTVDDVRRHEARRLGWLADKCLTDIRAADKVFVYCDRELSDPEQAIPLLTELRNIGPATLLIVLAERSRAGTVEHLTEGLLVAYVRQLTATHLATEYDWESWREILVAFGSIPHRPSYRSVREPTELPPDFDPQAYLALNPDVAAHGMDAGAHFLAHGWREKRRWDRVDQSKDLRHQPGRARNVVDPRNNIRMKIRSGGDYFVNTFDDDAPETPAD